MKLPSILLVIIACTFLQYSCSIIEKTSTHGFESGNYKLKPVHDGVDQVYLDITEDTVSVHIYAENQVNREAWVEVPLQVCDSLFHIPFRFSKQSLDIDITTILLKYRPAVHGIPAQLTTDFNVALYAGWRHDFYQLKGKTDPLGRNRYAVVSRGYDFGFFAGTGTTYLDDNTMLDPVNKEYSGMVIQFGMAGFLESSFASFGIATGFDYLLGPDRSSWIFNMKPWVGFIIGIALN